MSVWGDAMDQIFLPPLIEHACIDKSKDHNVT